MLDQPLVLVETGCRPEGLPDPVVTKDERVTLVSLTWDRLDIETFRLALPVLREHRGGHPRIDGTIERIERALKADADGCRLWPGVVQNEGYGITRERGHPELAHRVLFEHAKGPIPLGAVVDHICHNADETCPGGRECWHRRCVNPEHLEAVDDRLNRARGRHSNAQAKRTHCRHGHPFDEQNTYVAITRNGRPQRQCRACSRNRAARRRKVARP